MAKLEQVFNALMGWAAAHEALLWWLAVGSVAFFALMLFAVSWLVVRIPHDYFIRPDRYRSRFVARHPALRLVVRILASLLGIILVIAGILMLVLPGQGLLTILFGVMLIAFPGKDRLILYAVSRPVMRRAINAMRRRAGRQPLLLNSPQ